MTRALKGLVGIALLAIVASHVKAQCIVQEILPPPGGPVPNNFGDVASAGDVLAVGDFPGLAVPNVPGRVYVYRRIGGVWQYETTLHDPDGNQWTIFHRPATNGEVILVGAPRADGAFRFSGAVHAWRYRNGEWVYEQRLVGEGQLGGEFGFSLAIDGDVAVIGAKEDNYGGFAKTGALYVFRYDRAAAMWKQEQQLYAFGPAEEEGLGFAVGIDGDVIIGGAPGVDDGCGAVYVFRHDGLRWIGEAELTAFDAQIQDLLGISVHVNGDLAVAGAPNADQPGFISGGAAYSFVRRGARWAFEQKIIPADPTFPFFDFGWPITTTADGSVLIIGNSHDSFGAGGSGAAVLYRRLDGHWTQTGKLGHPEPSAGDGFCFSAITNGDQAIVAAINGGPEGGIVFAIDGIHQRDCDDDGFVDACAGVRGPRWPIIPLTCDEFADLDGDGFIGSTDVSFLLAAWGPCDAACAADLDADGLVDGFDLAYLLGFWGEVQT